MARKSGLNLDIQNHYRDNNNEKDSCPKVVVGYYRRSFGAYYANWKRKGRIRYNRRIAI